MKWVTRTYPHVDRTASAWLIKRFIDSEAEFIFINWPEEKPGKGMGTPFDIEGVELGHHDGKCTFETIVEKYNVEDPAVHAIAKLVHAADFRLEDPPEARGIRIVFTGLRLAAEDDYKTLETGFKIWDAIYAFYKAKELEDKYKAQLNTMSRSGRLSFLRGKVSTILKELKGCMNA